MAVPTASAGVPGSALPGPFAVGEYAAALRDRLRGFAHVQLAGEACDVRLTRAPVYFELRDVARGLRPPQPGARRADARRAGRRRRRLRLLPGECGELAALLVRRHRA